MSVPTCAHIKADGVLCGSPAMRRSRFCYFHDADRRQRNRMLQSARIRERANYAPPTAAQCRQIELIDIHTPRGLQRALDSVIQSLWSGNMDHSTATAMLNAINTKVRLPEQMPEQLPAQDSILEELQSLMASVTNTNHTSNPSVSGNLRVTD